MEEWRIVLGYEGLYQVSNEGNVRSLNYGKVRILKPATNKKGYLQVSLSKNNISKSFIVHRLVALTFIPNPDNKPQVNHINSIKTDNRIENLEWNTCKENIKHAFQNGLTSGKKGELHNDVKLTELEVLEIRKIYSEGNVSYRELAKIFDKVKVGTIFSIVHRKTWKHI